MLVTGCFAASPVMRFGEGKTQKQSQEQEYARVTPATFADHHEWSGPVSTAKIRVWADDAYRAQNVRWQQTFQEQLDNANDVLAAMFGVRLVADFRPWTRHAPGATLSDTLEALAKVDPGDDVLTVIALTSSLSLVTATFEQLGIADLGGHHIALRGYADGEERAWFEATFTELRAEERDVLYQARRRHKTTTTLIHELAHNLGAEHVADDDSMMSATYSERTASFDAHSQQIILAALDERLQRRHGAADVTLAAAAARPAPHPKMMLRVDDAGRPVMGGHAIDLATLDELFRMTQQDDPETEVVVHATKQAPQAAVITVIDHAKAAGLQHFALARP